MLKVWQIIFLFGIFLIVYMYAFNVAQKLVLRDEETIAQLNTLDTPLFEFSFQRNRGLDCTLNRLPCVTNQQCRDNCVIASAASELSCQQGFCNATTDSLATSPDSPSEIECDPALGLVRVFAAGGDFVVAQTCVSTHRDLVDDTGTPRPYLCDNGNLTLDLTTVQFSTQSCECSSGYTRMMFRQTALARTIPVCIPHRLIGLYRRVYGESK